MWKWYVTIEIIVFAVSCSQPKFSPWETKLPSSQKNHTAKNLNRLYEQEAFLGFSNEFTIAILGDPQGTPGDLKRVISRINERTDVEFLLVLGDLTDYGLRHEYQWTYDALANSKVPWFTAVGNHDALAHGKEIYQDMFGEFDYTFEYKGYKFVIWNNNLNEFGTTNFSFLEKELDDRSVVASHIPMALDVHSPDQLETWRALYKDRNIVTSMHGHRGTDINWEWEVDDILHYVVAKVDGVRYALVTFRADGEVTYTSCHRECPEEGGS